MNIKVNLTDDIPTHRTGGEYGVLMLEIFIDDRLPLRDQQENVIHSIVENTNLLMPHDGVDYLTMLIMDGLDQLQ